jgi:beta-glucosidase
MGGSYSATPDDHFRLAGTASPFEVGVQRVVNGEGAPAVADELLELLTATEKLWLLDGDQEFWSGFTDMVTNGYNKTPYVHGAVPRLGIPGLRFADGPRGCVMGESTAFPVPMARGATWDIVLEERVGLAIGCEVRAQGANFFGGICINLPRHPAWGRSQETYGEDPVLLGELGAAAVRGIQRNAMAAAKHFALNSMENARFSVDVTADESALHEVFLAHFRRVVEEGVSGIMSSYNSVNGEWAGQNEDLLEQVLRNEWGFVGVTVSDFVFGFRDPAKSLRAGLDVEEPFRQQRAQHLSADLASGRASWSDVDRAAHRILGAQLRHYASRDPEEPPLSVVFSPLHRTLSREVGARSIVVLRNEIVEGVPVLPLTASSLTRIALIGRLADFPNTGDHGSSDVHPPQVVTPYAGLRAALPDAIVDLVVVYDPEAVSEAAAHADVAVVVVGYSAAEEGEYLSPETFRDPQLMALLPPVEGDVDERIMPDTDSEEPALGFDGIGGDRTSLRLSAEDCLLIRSAASANRRTIVAIVAGGAVIIDDWDRDVSAVVVSWYAGSEGGHALTDVLLGACDASGRLPISIPRSEEHLPFFDRGATAITYDKWFGQRLLDRLKVPAAYPLGFGLSYTSFAAAELAIRAITIESVEINITVRNTGLRDGRHVVQVYGLPFDAGEDFPERLLLGFGIVDLAVGESKMISVRGSLRPLYRRAAGHFTPASETVTIEAASYAGDPNALKAVIPMPA